MSDLLSGIASFTKSVQNTLNSYEMRKIGDKVQGYVMNFTEAEAKVREATNEDPWGPTGPQMLELAGMTFQYDVFSEIMAMLWKRMFQENKVAWRRVYKSLILLNYLLKNGSERVISVARDHSFELRALESYKCFDERGKDEGINVRHRAKLVIELLQDDELLRVERRKAKTDGRDKYQGFSKEEMLYKEGGNFSSFKSWNSKSTFDSGNSDSNKFSTLNNETGQREITAFDFAESRNHTGSPELGIPDKSQEVNDNDEFGEFSEARSATAMQSNTKSVNLQISSVNTLAAVRIPPAPKSSSFVGKQNSQPSSVTANSNVGNLFSLSENDVKVSAMPDLFSDLKKKEPSLFTSSTAQAANLNTIDDIFGSQVYSASSVPAVPAVPASPVKDLLFSNGSINNLTNNNQDFFNTTVPANNTVDLFGSISTNMATSNTFDTLSSITAAPVVSNSSLTLLDGLQFTSSPSLYSNSPTVLPPAINGVLPDLMTSSTATKLPNTWEDLKGKVNIDFDNLTLWPQPSKPTLSLKELQEEKKNINNLG